MRTDSQILIAEYKSRINKAIDYIESNCDKQFTLEEIAGVANFSKFHFHRIFYGITGETPFQFITRTKLERAAFTLISDPRQTITEVALRFGFADIAVFSRSFKSYFKQSATQYRKAKNEKSNLSKMESKIEQATQQTSSYFCRESNSIKWRTNMEQNKGVEIKDFPKMTVAYIRHIGPYKGDVKLFETLWNKLFTWAGPRGLIGGENFKSLIVYHDDPGVTIEDKLRMSVCITVDPATKVDGEIGKMELEAAQYAVARFEITSEEFTQAWSWVCGQWLPASGYQPDDKPCFEMYVEEPKDGKFIVDICVPVKPL